MIVLLIALHTARQMVNYTLRDDININETIKSTTFGMVYLPVMFDRSCGFLRYLFQVEVVLYNPLV